MVFGLFKEKINSTDHKDIINYLIIEEAEQQWNYHKENNFEEEAFRGIPFARQTIQMFIEQILKLKVDEQVLHTIVDLGFRRGKEIVDEYKKLEKKYFKLEKKVLEEQYAICVKCTEKYLQDNQEIQRYNEIIMLEGYRSIDYEKRSHIYQVMCQNLRNFNIFKGIINKVNKNNKEKIDKIFEKGEKWLLNMDNKKKEKLFNSYSEQVVKTISSRNKNNLI